MKLSIVVCSYNHAPFIRETLDSLINQQNVGRGEEEIIVIDGASTDGSVEIIQEYKDRLAYFISEPDSGQTHALKKGFAKATGDILGWLCSDDLLEPGAARFILDYFRMHPGNEFIFGDAKIIDRRGELLKIRKEIPFNWFIWTYGDHNYIPQPSAFWTNRLYKSVNGLDESFNLDMDGDLWARFAERIRPRHVSKILSSVRVYPEVKSCRMRTQSVNEQRQICRRYGIDHDKPSTAALKILAKAVRVSWKTATGCYWYSRD